MLDRLPFFLSDTLCGKPGQALFVSITGTAPRNERLTTSHTFGLTARFLKLSPNTSPTVTTCRSTPQEKETWTVLIDRCVTVGSFHRSEPNKKEKKMGLCSMKGTTGVGRRCPFHESFCASTTTVVNMLAQAFGKGLSSTREGFLKRSLLCGPILFLNIKF